MGYVASRITSAFDDYLLEITLTMVTVYGCYLAAEQLIVQRLCEQFHKLADPPGLGPKRTELSPALRSARIGEYSIFYRPFSGVIEIVRVVHLQEKFL